MQTFVHAKAQKKEMQHFLFFYRPISKLSMGRKFSCGFHLAISRTITVGFAGRESQGNKNNNHSNRR